jgi:hypothetical protein
VIVYTMLFRFAKFSYIFRSKVLFGNLTKKKLWYLISIRRKKRFLPFMFLDFFFLFCILEVDNLFPLPAILFLTCLGK